MCVCVVNDRIEEREREREGENGTGRINVEGQVEGRKYTSRSLIANWQI